MLTEPRQKYLEKKLEIAKDRKIVTTGELTIIEIAEELRDGLNCIRKKLEKKK